MNKQSKIFVAGHSGMAGYALMRRLEKDGFTNVITKTHTELDLTKQQEVEDFFEAEKPEYVFLLAARAGGIADNRDHPADALYVNSMIELNVINSAYKNGVKKLLFTSSSTIYPELSPNPIGENALGKGPTEFFWGGTVRLKFWGFVLLSTLTVSTARILSPLFCRICMEEKIKGRLFYLCS
jgi:GDP-L-fucose synthase